MEKEVVIKVENVSKNFLLPHERAGSVKGVFTSMFSKATKKNETQHALKDISFEVKKGEFFGIVGRNGSGKSTLLKILAQIYQPTKGKIHISGKLVPFIELGVGFNPELTGRDNVYLNGAVLGFSKKQIEEIYDEIVDFAELRRFMDQKLKNYSSGMQVRLAFSLAIRAKADILLFDEVLAVGDADFMRKCFNHFRELKKQQKTVVFVSHDMNSIREYCDRALLIDNSRMVTMDTANEVAKEYSRMFFDSDTSTGNLKKEKRWGNKKISYTNLSINTKILSDQKYLEVTCIAKANEDLEEVIFGFLVKNASGLNLLGINSKIKRQSIKNLKKGDKTKIQWNIPNIFADGTYILDPSIVLYNGEVCDWWEDALTFDVRKEDHAAYIVAPDIGLEITGHYVK